MHQLEDIPILHVSSSQNSVNIINNIANSHKEWLDVSHTIQIDHDYFSQTCLPLYTTRYKSEVISYIAGCIISKLQKDLHCTQYINALIVKDAETDHNML